MVHLLFHCWLYYTIASAVHECGCKLWNFWSSIVADFILVRFCDEYWYFYPNVSWQNSLLICKSQIILKYFEVGFECWRWEHYCVSKCWCLTTSLCYVILQMSRMPINVDGWKSAILSLFYIHVSTFCVISLTTLVMWVCVNMCVCLHMHACVPACMFVCMWNMYVCKEKILFDLFVIRDWE